MLTLEPLLIQRLKDTVSGVRAVLSADELAGIEESKQVVPALQVFYRGFRVIDDGYQGMALIEETWLAVAVISHSVQGKRATAATRQRMAAIANPALFALLGWNPGDKWTPLKPTTPPPARWSDSFGYLPMAFTTQLFVKGL